MYFSIVCFGLQLLSVSALYNNKYGLLVTRFLLYILYFI